MVRKLKISIIIVLITTAMSIKKDDSIQPAFLLPASRLYPLQITPPITEIPQLALLRAAWLWLH